MVQKRLFLGYGVDMSGGRYDYEQNKIRRVTEDVAKDLAGPADPHRPWLPKDQVLASLVEEMGSVLYSVCNDVDRHVSGDSEIPDIRWYRVCVMDHFRAILDRVSEIE